jgi:hypothetical protein
MRRTALVLAVGAAFAAGAAPASGAGALRTAIFEPFAFAREGQQETAFDRTRRTGARMVRLTLHWVSVAPQGGPPAQPRNPFDPSYNWGWFDTQIRLATARGLEPFVEVMFAPSWASQGAGGTIRPDPVAFGDFAYAAAARYSGLNPGLPRVRFWQAWGEPNRDYFLFPSTRAAGSPPLSATGRWSSASPRPCTRSARATS